MKKRDLEKQSRAFHGNTQADAGKLRARVSSDLNLVKDAYDVGAIALTELAKLMANVQFSDKPTKDIKELSSAYKDIASTLIALRGEGRTTIAEAVNSVQSTDGSTNVEPLTPLSPDAGDGRGGTTDPPKFFPPHSSTVMNSPTPIGEFLSAHVGDDDESI